jgi:hypothetical protein
MVLRLYLLHMSGTYVRALLRHVVVCSTGVTFFEVILLLRNYYMYIIPLVYADIPPTYRKCMIPSPVYFLSSKGLHPTRAIRISVTFVCIDWCLFTTYP